MASLLLYSTNPWYAHEVAEKYLGGRHFVWCCEYYDPARSAISSMAPVAPSSSPKSIYSQLENDCNGEDRHSRLINGYRKTFRRLALSWFSTNVVSDAQRDEILTTVNAKSWRIWRPILYLIPRAAVESAGRLICVPAAQRASYANEWQIVDLMTPEFEILER